MQIHTPHAGLQDIMGKTHNLRLSISTAYQNASHKPTE